MNFHTFISKILIRSTILIVSCCILTGCFSEYREHFTSENSKPSILSGEYLGHSPDESIWVLPDRGIKQNIIDSIYNANERIWIQIYMWTDKDIMNAVIDAHKRGVDVKVLLERNVYNLPKVNTSIYSTLTKEGISVKYTDSYRFTFTHAKFWIIDNRYFISTGNLTKSFFESNRDFVFHSSDTETLGFLSILFLGDFSYLGIDKSRIPDHIVLSPVDSRSKVEYLIHTATSDIKLYTQTLTDPHIIELLEEKKGKGINVQICTADNESNRESITTTTLPWTKVKKPYLHGKIIFIDSKNIFLGSQNLTTNSLENNREVGIIFSHTGSISSRLLKYYNSDCIYR